MKKIGFIDYYLDEWHANEYPGMIQKASNGSMTVCCAYGKIDSPLGGMTNQAWAEKNRIALLPTIEEVVEKSDCIIVLSPDNPEMHEELSGIPASSGKRIYIDKTFANDRETAKRIFDLARRHHTPVFSSSALNFSSELRAVEKHGIESINSRGGGSFDAYSIHQIEPVVALMGGEARRVMSTGTDSFPALTVAFSGERRAHIAHIGGIPFSMDIGYGDKTARQMTVQSDFFGNFIAALVDYFNTGIIPVSHEQTLAAIAIRAAGIKALAKPFTWIDV